MPRPIPAGSSGIDRGLIGILFNPALEAGLLACIIAQLAKVATHYHSDRVIDWGRALSSGGMPSSHTALIVAATAAIGCLEGTTSNLFALAVILSLVVMYDASGVRLHAGRHASLLTMIISELPPEHPVQASQQTQNGVALNPKLGHTPLEVLCGAAVGLVVGYLYAAVWQHAHAGG